MAMAIASIPDGNSTHPSRLTPKNVFRHKLRTRLTICGIVVEILSVEMLQMLASARCEGANSAAATQLVTVVFALMVFWNLLGAHWLFGQSLSARLLVGASCGLGGVALVFWPELAALSGDQASLKGLLLAILATLAASAGNLLSQRLFARNVAVLPCTAWAMMYGAIGVAIYCLIAGVHFTWDDSIAYQEGYAWTLPALTGMLLVVIGNVLVMWRK